MRILDIVPPEAVVDDLRAETKEGVLRELAGILAAMAPQLPAEAIASVLIERESLGSTGIGEGVAIPHGKIEGIDRLHTVFGRSRTGIQFHSLDGKPARLFFVIIAPAQSAGMHLKALARISRLLKDERFRRSLVDARDVVHLREIFQAEETR